MKNDSQKMKNIESTCDQNKSSQIQEVVKVNALNSLVQPRFSIKDVTIHEQKRLFERHFALDLYRVSYQKYDGSTTKILDREIFERHTDAVAILPFDPITEEVVLIEQFRPGALKDPVSPWLIEVVAGMIDEGESELEAAVRELKEESSLEIKPQDLHYINAVYPSPGGCSERVTLYIGKVDCNHLEAFGGLDDESEDIRIFKLPVHEAFACCKNGRINNAAALLTLQHLELYYDEIRNKLLEV